MKASAHCDRRRELASQLVLPRADISLTASTKVFNLFLLSLCPLNSQSWFFLMHMLNTQHIPWTRSLKLWKGKLWIWACKVDTDQLFPKPSPLSWTCFSGPLIIRQARDGALVDGIELVELPATFRPGTCLPYSRFRIFQSIANDQGHLGKSYVK